MASLSPCIRALIFKTWPSLDIAEEELLQACRDDGFAAHRTGSRKRGGELCKRVFACCKRKPTKPSTATIRRTTTRKTDCKWQVCLQRFDGEDFYQFRFVQGQFEHDHELHPEPCDRKGNPGKPTGNAAFRELHDRWESATLASCDDDVTKLGATLRQIRTDMAALDETCQISNPMLITRFLKALDPSYSDFLSTFWAEHDVLPKRNKDGEIVTPAVTFDRTVAAARVEEQLHKHPRPQQAAANGDPQGNPQSGGFHPGGHPQNQGGGVQAQGGSAPAQTAGNHPGSSAQAQSGGAHPDSQTQTQSSRTQVPSSRARGRGRGARQVTRARGRGGRGGSGIESSGREDTQTNDPDREPSGPVPTPRPAPNAAANPPTAAAPAPAPAAAVAATSTSSRPAHAAGQSAKDHAQSMAANYGYSGQWNNGYAASQAPAGLPPTAWGAQQAQQAAARPAAAPGRLPQSRPSTYGWG